MIIKPPNSLEDPVWVRYQNEFAEHYHEVFYESNPIIRFVQEAGHRLVEKPFTKTEHFPRVLEVGAGSGEHLYHVRHSYDEYIVSDLNSDIIEQSKSRYGDQAKLTFQVQNCSQLDLPDNSIDRLISIYNLEHMAKPYLVLKEWKRVLKPGGMLSISIPTEGGLAWNLGRYLTTRRTFIKKGFDWDYIIARDHVNSCPQLLAFIRHYFTNRQESWFPTGIPLHHVNLVYAVNIKVNKNIL
jgi:phosphatidylethanolamine/phosphatidyl-N-methylethanolamine N-methyltransferase